MSHIRKNKTKLVSLVVTCFTLLLCSSCNKKEVQFFAQGKGPDLVFKITPKDSALCYISFQSEPYKLSEVNKEDITLNGNIDISWKSKSMPNDVVLKLKVNDKQVSLNDTFSLTISSLIGKREQFFYYNDVLKNVPLFIANIHESHQEVDSLFYVRAAQQITVTKINVSNPLNIDLSTVVGSKQESKKTNQIIEEREYINPADFPGVK
ncbi:MAG: hypothetical protein IPG89_01655 [Bacteroidetes bacterium]|nr:hypothetical protein [Bacteroidota bacterium]